MLNKARTNLSPLSNFRQDIPAGIAVFLVALPLCLGIALASGAPLISGIIAGIVGGLVVGFISNSSLGVSGPAAGLTVLVLTGIEELGFSAFLLAVIFAGMVQITLGVLRAGIIGYYFPSTVISGMLFGIGLIIILKQIPHAIGYDKDYEGDMNFHQSDGYNTLNELTHAIDLISPTAIVIAVVAFIILILWDSKWVKSTKVGKLVPGSLIAVMSGVGINLIINAIAPEYSLSANHFVAIPVEEEGLEIFSHLTFPDFRQLTNPAIYFTGVTIAIIASLETLLCVEATDKLDPHKRSTNTNRELIAQGVGNMTSGLIGGIPVTQVIVRSSANVQANGQTKTSAITHGALLLSALVAIPHLLNLIPLATLAAILIVVGYKLAHPKTLIKMYRSGIFHFVPFIATVGGLVFTDLLTGVIMGSCVAIASILLENYKMGVYYQETQKGSTNIIHLAEHVSFLNKANLLEVLNDQPVNSELIINATSTKFIDYDVREIIDNFKIEAKDKNIDFKFYDQKTSHPVRTKINQESLTPAQALTILKEGNLRFVNNLQSHHDVRTKLPDSSVAQFPFAIILSCIDSRTSAELIFDQGMGDVFSVRIAGNVVNEDIIGSMEYACSVVGSKLIVVLGHTNCGTIEDACSDRELENLTGLLDKIRPAVHEVHEHHVCDPDQAEFVNKVAECNVARTRQHILDNSQTLHGMVGYGKIDIVGGMYDVESGAVRFF